ncbi:MAG: hypothetical protein APF81_13640 [Desulfosporosinus sp. BRH_c37]|nr:MAG: hypothetical protein APF81_13640 [Desulfosporosinus sp. BRH_c37]
MDIIASPALQIIVGINIIMALGLFITVSAGQFSLGHASLAGIGAYISAVLTVNLHWPFLAAVIVGALAAGIFGAIFAIPALRTRGIYLSVLTLGLGELVRVFFSTFEYTGGVAGFGGMKGTTVGIVYLTLLFCLIAVGILMRSPLGRAFQTVAADEMVAEALGLNTVRLKVLAFSLGGMMTALGGALYAHFMFFIDPHSFNYNQSVFLLIFVVFGGMESMWGVVLGTLILTLLPEYFRGLDQWRMVIYGLVLIFMMAVRPQGIITKRLLRKVGRGFAYINKRNKELWRFESNSKS